MILCFSRTRHESAMGAHVSPLILKLPPHSIPLGLSQSTCFESPASCNEFELVIYFIYGDVHVSLLLFSQINPPSPFPTWSESLFTSVSFVGLHIES